MPLSQQPAVFLDRDGTIIADVHYLAEPSQIQLIPGAAAAIRRLNQAGFRVIVVTNQAGVALGRFSEDKIDAVHERLSALLAESRAIVDGYFFCPHHPQGIVEPYAQVCRCRKPEPGMLLTAAQEQNLDLERSWMIGDKVSDLAAGAAVGCQTILVRTGHGSAVTEPLSPALYRLAGIAADLGQAVDLGPCRQRESNTESPPL
ncbi:MAG: HAD family hydrolase [Bacteroidales bacterium]|nr:HAD family hydrolase [Bacteroidales bacterium]